MQREKEKEPVLTQSSDAVLYDRWGQAIFAYLRLHTPTREDAEDLTLEVFMAALERTNLTGMSDREQLTWLRRVARNKLVDQYRRSSRHGASVTLETIEETMYDDERLSPEHVALREEEYRQLHTAIRTLPGLQQEVLRLRFSHGLRFAEIATLLNKREEAVRKLFSRTLAFLRNRYDQEQGGKH